MSLQAIITDLKKVDARQKEEMFLLYERYFSNISRDVFLRDMNEKDWVILLRDGCGLAGFSTLQVIRMDVEGSERVFLFSGDTIVDREHWQDSKLAGAFGHFMLRLMDVYRDKPLYWFLISKGFRTYRFLPVYFKKFFPVHNQPTPSEYSALIRSIAVSKFNGAFDQDAGLVRFNGQRDRLKPEMCDVGESRRNDPHVKFFLGKNPDYRIGDELACIADISRENLNKYAWRVIESTAVRWDE